MDPAVYTTQLLYNAVVYNSTDMLLIHIFVDTELNVHWKSI